MENRYNYNLTGTERKAFVKAISEILGEPAVYKKAPSFAYQVGFCTVDKNGTLMFPDNTNAEEAKKLVGQLAERGYNAENAENIENVEVTEEPEEGMDTVKTENTVIAAENTEPAPTESTISEAGDSVEVLENADRERPLDIALPLEGFDGDVYLKLTQIIASKEEVIKKSLGVDNLPVVVKEDRVIFPWFTLLGIDGEADAYTHFVTALVNMAKNQKRITAKAKEVSNEKYTMRLFLVRLGMIGDKYKTARKILLQNLSGNGSWKAGEPPRKAPKAATEALEAAQEPALEDGAVPAEYMPEKGGAPYGKQ